MLDIKIFNDGDRKVAVFAGDNITNIPDEVILQKMMVVFADSKAKVDKTTCNVEPLNTTIPELPDEKPVQATPVTPASTETQADSPAVDTEEEPKNEFLEKVTTGDAKTDYTAFIELCTLRKSKDLSKEDKHLVNTAIRVYCNNRFNNCNAEEYANKLNPKQLKNFVTTFGELAPSASTDSDEESVLRSSVIALINKFKQ